jgi:enediyne biosynthesis thioesterase
MNEKLFTTKINNAFPEDISELLAAPPTEKGRTFTLKFDTSLKHSNATQNIYFSNYVEWQGAIRERWFFECIAPDMLQDKGVFVTKEVQQYYLKEAFPFETIKCCLNSFRVQRCAFRLLFRYFKDDTLLSYGCQHIVFTDHEKRIVRLPYPVLEKVKQFQIEL